MDTNSNGTSSAPQSLTTPTDPFPLISSDVAELLTMSNFPFENFDAQDQPPHLESPPIAVSLDTMLAGDDSNRNDVVIESVVSLNNRDTSSSLKETVPPDNSEEEVHTMVRVSPKSLDILTPPDANHVRYFISDLEGEEEIGCARTAGGYNLRPMMGRLGQQPRWKQKRELTDGGKNKHPANPNKKRRQKGVESEERECETNGTEASVGIQDEHEGEIREASDAEEVDVDCEAESSDRQLLKLDQLDDNDQIAADDEDIHALIDPGTLQKQLLADIWNDSPHTVNRHVPTPSQETQDTNIEMHSVSIDLCSQCSATQDSSKNEHIGVTVVTFDKKKMDDVDKELLKEAELGNKSLTESSMEGLVIDAPSSMEESPLLQSQQTLLQEQPPEGCPPNQETPRSATYDQDHSRDVIPDSQNATLDQDYSHNVLLDQDLLRDALPDQDFSHDVIPDQDLSHDNQHSLLIDELITIDTNHLSDDSHGASHNMMPVSNLPSPDYSPIHDQLFPSPDHSDASHSLRRSPTPHHSSPAHTDYSESPFSPQGQFRSHNVSKAPWNAFLSPSTPSSPDPLALPPKRPSLQKFPSICKSLTMPPLRVADKTYFMRVYRHS